MNSLLDDKRTQVWMYISIITGLLPWIAILLFFDALFLEDKDIYRTAALLIAWLSLAVVAVNIISAFKIKGRKKLVPIVVALLTSALGYYAWFGYSWSFYGG